MGTTKVPSCSLRLSERTKVRRCRGSAACRQLLLAWLSLLHVAAGAQGAASADPAVIDAECLAIEQAFARNDTQTLSALEPEDRQWQALKAFRLASTYIPEDKRREALTAIRQGLQVIKEGLRDNPEDVELLLLGTMLDGEYLLVQRWRFLHNGLRGLRRIARAEKLEPDNPRARLIRGSAKVVLPGLLGGSPEDAEQLLQPGVRSTALCENGDWGQVDLLNWLGRAAEAQGDAARAQQYYEAALARSPGNHWVRLAIEGNGYEWQEDPEP